MTTPRIRAVATLLWFLGSAFCGTTAWADDYQEGNRLYKEGKRAEALDRLNAYLAQRPKDARARFLSGVILTEQNKIQDAIKVFSELTQDYPELPEPYNNLAVLYAGLGDTTRRAMRSSWPFDAPELRDRARESRRYLRQDGLPGL
jgi:TolA-binding protein